MQADTKATQSRRRINRFLNHERYIISDRIATVAIPEQKETLIRLMHLNNQSENELIHSKCNEFDSLETKLTLFQQLQSEINQTIDQLHNIHDPTHVLGKEIESFKEALAQALSNAVEEDLFAHPKAISKIWQECQSHFFIVMKKFNEIQYIYSYKNITRSAEPFSQTFVSDLTKQLAECRKLLEVQRLTWAMRNTISLDRQRALTILDLSETASHNDIRQAYLRLCFIHHPDKGGDPKVFSTIHAAYEFLTNREAIASRF
jgi:hypothetical protein